jgi:hypothetical protein
MRIETNTNSLYGTAVQRKQATSTADFTSQLTQTTAVADDDNAAASSGAYDFTSMTPNQMQGAAEDLYDSGAIDLTQLFKLQTAGMPLGKQGPDGSLVPLSSAQKASYANAPVDYIQTAKDAMSYIEQQGRSTDPTSGYDQWQGILSALETNQGQQAPSR